MKKTRTFRQRARRIATISLGLALLATALPVAVLRVVPPLGSALMLERWFEARAAGRSFRLRYEWVPARAIAPSLRAAVVVSEDQRFYDHDGFDWRAMQSAVGEWRDGERLRGASTISQQLAKNLFLWPGRSLLRKGLEAWFTLWLEWLWPKARILEVYLNVVELGDGVFGVEAAARRHFGKSAAQLDAHESALLAAMLPSPRRSSAANPSRTLRERQRWILRQL
jgi:monofunctional biosynthetic peptidoglycan transglycosylase